MAYFIEATPPSTPSAELRVNLEELEKLLLKPNGMTIERILILLDKAWLQMRDLHDRGVDLKAEEGLWSGFEIRLRKGAGEFVQAARAHSGLASLRRNCAQTDGFWWHLDDIYRAHNRRSLFRTLRWLGTAGGLVLGVWIVMTYVIPPDETAVLLSEITHDLEQAVSIRDFTAARAIVEDGLLRTDDATELLLWASMIAEREGDGEAAAAYRTAAFKSDIPPAQLWVSLGNHRMRAGDLEGAACAALTALEWEEAYAQAYFLLGGVAEMSGDIDRALEYFDKTYDLAVQSQPQLAVMARVRMGYMMQSPGPLTPAEGRGEERGPLCT